MAIASAGCDGELVNLGTSQPLNTGGDGGGGGAAVSGSAGAGEGAMTAQLWQLQITPVIAQEEGVQLANPTLTADMQELYYSTQQRGGSPEPNTTSVAHAVLLVDGRWGSVSTLTLGEPMPDVSSPAISEDGLELWVGINTTGSTDVFKSVKQGGFWMPPVPVPELNSKLDDVPRPPGLGGTIMPLSSKRHGGSLYQIYFATRATKDAAWGEPSQQALVNINSSAFQSADGFLSSDGLELYFSSTRAGNSDLYVATRTDLTAAFGEPAALVDLNDKNGASEERMPWLSPSGDQLYFASNMSGQYGLYRADNVAR
jgi:hypothetical protein